MTVPKRLSLYVLWVALATLIATLYGVMNDQITVTISPEYFSVFKRRMFWWLVGRLVREGASLRVQTAAIGAMASWWLGVILGGLLAPVGLAGKSAHLSTLGFLRAILLVMAITFSISIVFGVAAYVTVLHPVYGPGNEFLYGITDTRDAYAVGFWHDGAYLGAIVGTVVAGIQMVRWRSQESGKDRD